MARFRNPIHYRRFSYAGFYSTKAGSLWTGGDNNLLIATIILIAFGVMMIYSASGFIAVDDNKPDYYYFIKQLALVGVGFLAFLFGAKVDTLVYRRWVKVGSIALGIVMVLQLLLPIGPTINGARRWVSLGLFNLQTSEVARCMVIVYLARVFSDEPDLAERLSERLLKVLVVPIVFLGLTFVQPDLSSSAMIACIMALILFLAGMKLYLLLTGGFVGLAGVIILALQNPYQKKRLLGFIDPFADLEGINYQTFQSLVGFAKGGFFGVGLGESGQKMLYLPYPFTDMIYSVIGEEWGLIGSTFVLLTFLGLYLRTLRISLKLADRYSFFLSAGLGGSLIIYALVNMGVALSLLPATGLPMPFISAGGTSLVVSMWSIGVLWRLSKEANSYV